MPRDSTRDRVVDRGEILWVGLTIALLTLGSIDAVREIPPLADDYWYMTRGPGQLAGEYFRDYGWGRPLGMLLMDAINTVRAVFGASVLAAVLVMRVAVLAAIYLTLRRLYGWGKGLALLTAALIAWNPAASEAWVLLCNLHLATSVVLVVVACGLYRRALQSAPEASALGVNSTAVAQQQWRWIVGGAAVQVAVNFTYEQSLLAVPAFVGVLGLFERGQFRPRLSRMAAPAVAAGVALASGLVMFATGYVASRSRGATTAAAELSDLSSALHALWIGFGEHHVWRAIEAVRTGQLLWWDSSLLGLAALAATLAASALVAWRLIADRSTARPADRVALAVAALAAAYASLLPTGLAYPGYTIFSRLYYVPGVFGAIAVTALVPSRWPVSRLAIGVAAGAAMLWLGTVSRRYFEDTRQGSRILRVVARSVAQVPYSVRRDGLLVIAPSNVGTFSTSAVEPWSLRPAVRALTRVNPEGPLSLVTDCAELERENPQMYREGDRASQWGAVLRYQNGGVQMTPTIALACRH